MGTPFAGMGKAGGRGKREGEGGRLETGRPGLVEPSVHVFCRCDKRVTAGLTPVHELAFFRTDSRCFRCDNFDLDPLFGVPTWTCPRLGDRPLRRARPMCEPLPGVRRSRAPTAFTQARLRSAQSS